MAECTPELRVCLSTALCLLTGVMLACLVRAIRGPRYTERLVALNLICTVVVLMVLSRISVRRHREKRGEEP